MFYLYYNCFPEKFIIFVCCLVMEQMPFAHIWFLRLFQTRGSRVSDLITFHVLCIADYILCQLILNSLQIQF